MTIDPVRCSVVVMAPPERAFVLFTRDIGRWWSPRMSTGKNPYTDILIEPWAGGRWLEVDAQGAETLWGDVMVWQPPHRLVLGWRLNSQYAYDPDFLTEVELTFTSQDGGARVTLEHRNLERYGADAAKISGQLGGGWPTLLDLYAGWISDSEANGASTHA